VLRRQTSPQLPSEIDGERSIVRKPAHLVNTTLALVSVVLLAASVLGQQSRHPKHATSSVNGQQIFASACAGCHGLDGRGGERAPNIAQAPAAQRLSDQNLIRIVAEGVPGTGMPAFHSLGTDGISAVVTYLRVLQGRGEPSVLPGDPTRGQALFFGRAECSSCHMIGGQGGFLASDLSGYGKGHSVEEIRQAILNAGRDSDLHVKHAVVTAEDGKQYDGLVRNEDNFSIQLQAMDGSYHFFEKADVRNVQYQAEPVMPSNYDSTLSHGELNDIISYLVAAAKSSQAEAASEREE
jgi:cytochrome c oxidase cbb3-type subunit III